LPARLRRGDDAAVTAETAAICRDLRAYCDDKHADCSTPPGCVFLRAASVLERVGALRETHGYAVHPDGLEGGLVGRADGTTPKARVVIFVDDLDAALGLEGSGK
jgi:hypothetical protein